MKEYIEKYLRQTIEIKKNTELFKKLPLKYKGSYELFSVFQAGIEWILIQPRIEIRLNALRYDRNQIEKAAGLNCALFFTKLNQYSKDRMMDEGIPFIIAEKQMFLPFLGMLLSEKGSRNLKPVHTISFLTQKLLLCALYEKWQNMNVTKMAERLGVTKMSVSRCLDEIEYLEIDVLDVTAKTRKISVHDEPKSLWNKIQPFLRNPVIAKFQLTENIELERKAGLSALCEYSLLSDNPYPTYGITKKELQEVKLKDLRTISVGEEIGCEVLELGYFIDFKNQPIQDPLSIILTIPKEDMEDERVQMCVEEMLEDYVW